MKLFFSEKNPIVMQSGEKTEIIQSFNTSNSFLLVWILVKFHTPAAFILLIR